MATEGAGTPQRAEGPRPRMGRRTGGGDDGRRKARWRGGEGGGEGRQGGAGVGDSLRGGLASATMSEAGNGPVTAPTGRDDLGAGSVRGFSLEVVEGPD